MFVLINAIVLKADFQNFDFEHCWRVVDKRKGHTEHQIDIVFFYTFSKFFGISLNFIRICRTTVRYTYFIRNTDFWISSSVYIVLELEWSINKLGLSLTRTKYLYLYLPSLINKTNLNHNLQFFFEFWMGQWYTR